MLLANIYRYQCLSISIQIARHWCPQILNGVTTDRSHCLLISRKVLRLIDVDVYWDEKSSVHITRYWYWYLHLEIDRCQCLSIPKCLTIYRCWCLLVSKLFLWLIGIVSCWDQKVSMPSDLYLFINSFQYPCLKIGVWIYRCQCLSIFKGLVYW